jgi:hypothetical protein
MKHLFILILFLTTAFGNSYNHKMQLQIEESNAVKNTFSFAVFGDNRGRDDILEKIILDINKDKDILFGLNNGDVVSVGFESEFKNYLALIKKSKKPIITVLGNHGIGLFEDESNFKSSFGETYFSFAFQNSYFIILNGADDEGISQTQLTWLTNELKKSQKYTNRFVFIHIPLYDPRAGKYARGHSLENLTQAKELNNLFDTYKVTMLFASHIHSYYKGNWQKTPYIITGGAGAPLVDCGFFHYIKVTVTRNKITYKVKKIQ